MDAFEQSLRNLTLAPYIVKAMALIGVKRRAGSNMFRHQLSTMAILLDYKIIDPILLKASVIHDLFEDAAGMPGVTREDIERLDADGPAVYNLVMEVTQGTIDGVPESKAAYLSRVMEHGSDRARVLRWPTVSATSPRSVSYTTPASCGSIWTKLARTCSRTSSGSTPICFVSCPIS